MNIIITLIIIVWLLSLLVYALYRYHNNEFFLATTNLCFDALKRKKTVTHICKSGKVILKVDNTTITSVVSIRNN